MKTLVLMLGLAVAQCAGASTATPRPVRTASPEDVVRALAARADARSLATAAALAAQAAPPQPTALELITRANDLAPQDAAINWLHLQLCVESPTCDSRDVATAMRWVDPDNSAAWMPILAAAQRDRDKVEIDRVLADMAEGTRFDMYWNQTVTMLFDTLQDAKATLPRGAAMGDAARFTEVSDIAAAHLIPPFAPLSSVCREARPRSQRHRNCLKLARIMERGDTVIAQIAGFDIEKTLVGAESKEARSIAERRNLLEWRSTAAGKLDIPLLPWTANSRIRARLAEMRLRPREEDVCIALLRNHQQALEPAEKHR